MVIISLLSIPCQYDANQHEINEQQGHISEANVLLMQLETNIDAIEEFVRLGKLANKTIILNPAPYTKNVSRLLPSIDILTPNETEASFLSGITILNIDDAQKAGNIILQSGVEKVIITLGAQGSLLCERHRTLFIPARVPSSKMLRARVMHLMAHWPPHLPVNQTLYQPFSMPLPLLHWQLNKKAHRACRSMSWYYTGCALNRMILLISNNRISV